MSSAEPPVALRRAGDGEPIQDALLPWVNFSRGGRFANVGGGPEAGRAANCEHKEGVPVAPREPRRV
eukprot:5092780-Lingulodinium_polyedra.AAC.1